MHHILIQHFYFSLAQRLLFQFDTQKNLFSASPNGKNTFIHFWDDAPPWGPQNLSIKGFSSSSQQCFVCLLNDKSHKDGGIYKIQRFNLMQQPNMCGVLSAMDTLLWKIIPTLLLQKLPRVALAGYFAFTFCPVNPKPGQWDFSMGTVLVFHHVKPLPDAFFLLLLMFGVII